MNKENDKSKKLKSVQALPQRYYPTEKSFLAPVVPCKEAALLADLMII